MVDKRKVKYVCSTCGSDDVRRDAYAEWDVERQEWVLSVTFDEAVCEKCGGQTRLKVYLVGGIKSTTSTLAKSVQRLLLNAVKGHGFDGLYRIEESLTGQEFEDCEAFIAWLKKNNRSFGYNIAEVVSEWEAAR